MSRSRVTSATACFALAGGFYLLLIDTVSLPELYAGCGATLLATAAFAVSREQGFAEASATLRLLVDRLWPVAVRVPGDVALLCRDALIQLVVRKRERGRFRAIPFEAGGDGSADVGRRALAEIAGSLAPNTIVLGVDQDRNLLLIHQFNNEGRRRRRDPLRLG